MKGGFNIGFNVPSGGGTGVVELSGDPTAWPAGSADGDWGYVTATGAPYRWRATDSSWIAPEAFSAGTLSLFASIDGDENQAAIEGLGYTVTRSSGGVLTNATIGGNSYVSLDTGAVSGRTCYLSRTVTSGQGHYYAGHVRITKASAASATHCMIPYLRDGSRIYWLNGAAAPNEARFSPVAFYDNSSNDLWTASVWFEMLILPGGTATARANHGSWFATIAASQCGPTASTDEFIGDSSGTASATINLRAFKTWDIA